MLRLELYELHRLREDTGHGRWKMSEPWPGALGGWGGRGRTREDKGGWAKTKEDEWKRGYHQGCKTARKPAETGAVSDQTLCRRLPLQAVFPPVVFSDLHYHLGVTAPGSFSFLRVQIISGPAPLTPWWPLTLTASSCPGVQLFEPSELWVKTWISFDASVTLQATSAVKNDDHL